ncbi:hypothetical protein [Oerskovia turbata]
MPTESSDASHPERAEHAEGAEHADAHGARRRAMTWGAGALTFSVLTLGGFALSAPATTHGTGGAGPAAGLAASSTEVGPEAAAS